jgi:hypothetical protein
VVTNLGEFKSVRIINKIERDREKQSAAYIARHSVAKDFTFHPQPGMGENEYFESRMDTPWMREHPAIREFYRTILPVIKVVGYGSPLMFFMFYPFLVKTATAQAADGDYHAVVDGIGTYKADGANAVSDNVLTDSEITHLHDTLVPIEGKLSGIIPVLDNRGLESDLHTMYGNIGKILTPQGGDPVAINENQDRVDAMATMKNMLFPRVNETLKQLGVRSIGDGKWERFDANARMGKEMNTLLDGIEHDYSRYREAEQTGLTVQDISDVGKDGSTDGSGLHSYIDKLKGLFEFTEQWLTKPELRKQNGINKQYWSEFTGLYETGGAKEFNGMLGEIEKDWIGAIKELDTFKPVIKDVNSAKDVEVGARNRIYINASDDNETDFSGMDKVEVRITVPDKSEVTVSAARQQDGSWVADYTPAQPGSYSWKVIAKDKSGNEQTEVGGFSAWKDTTPPTIDNVDYSRSMTTGQQNDVVVNVADERTGVESVVVQVKGLDENNKNIVEEYAAKSGGSGWFANFTPIIPGNYSMKIVAKDGRGNAASKTVPFNASLPPDTVAPQISNLAMPSKTGKDGSYVASARVTDDRNVKNVWLVDNGNYLPMTKDDDTWTYEGKLKPGRHDVQIIAEDGSGNKAQSNMQKFTYAQPSNNGPVLAGGGAAAIGTALGVAAYGLHRRKKAREAKRKKQADDKLLAETTFPPTPKPEVIGELPPEEITDSKQVKDVFMIYQDGRLIQHLTNDYDPTLDSEIIGSMFTAVQQFVQDSFAKGGGISDIGFHDKRIYIRKDGQFYVAAVAESGADWLPERLGSIIGEIENDYAGMLADWDGDKSKFKGADRYLRELFGKPAGWEPPELPPEPVENGMKKVNRTQQVETAIKAGTTELAFEQETRKHNYQAGKPEPAPQNGSDQPKAGVQPTASKGQPGKNVDDIIEGILTKAK